MKINTIKRNEEVTISLSGSDLKNLCDILKNSNYYELYADLLIAKDLCNQGYIDNLCLEQVEKARNQIIKF